jgi:hypothetical protein
MQRQVQFGQCLDLQLKPYGDIKDVATPGKSIEWQDCLILQYYAHMSHLETRHVGCTFACNKVIQCASFCFQLVQRYLERRGTKSNRTFESEEAFSGYSRVERVREAGLPRIGI